jgi:voltage-gated potassium channel
MSGKDSARAELGNTGYEIFIAALSVLSLVNLVLVFALRDPATQTVVRTIDLLLSVVFLIDFLTRLHRAASRAGYFFRQFGWADLLASLPLPYAKVLRVFRLARVVRLLRRYGAGNIGRSLIRDRAGSALLTLLMPDSDDRTRTAIDAAWSEVGATCAPNVPREPTRSASR